MSRKSGVLTPARLGAAKALLAQYPFGSYDTVLATLTEQFGFPVTGENLGRAFERAGLSTPQSYTHGAPLAHCATCKCKPAKKSKCR